MSPTGTAAPKFFYDMTGEGWKVIEDVEKPKISALSRLEIVSFLEEGEEYISGDKMRSRAKEKEALLGQIDAEYLLKHSRKIPKQYRVYRLVFPATVWRSAPHGGRWIPYLYWEKDCWHLGFQGISGEISGLIFKLVFLRT